MTRRHDNDKVLTQGIATMSIAQLSYWGEVLRSITYFSDKTHQKSIFFKLEGAVRKFVRTNLFRKYLNYSEHSRFTDMFICTFWFSRGPFGAICSANLAPYPMKCPSKFRANLQPNWSENNEKTKKSLSPK